MKILIVGAVAAAVIHSRWDEILFASELALGDLAVKLLLAVLALAPFRAVLGLALPAPGNPDMSTTSNCVSSNGS